MTLKYELRGGQQDRRGIRPPRQGEDIPEGISADLHKVRLFEAIEDSSRTETHPREIFEHCQTGAPLEEPEVKHR
jgi:hypothetical protein